MLATVVGETTAGAANAAGVVPLVPGLALMLSGGRTQHAVTGTNSEGVGVKPEVAAPSADALKAVLERIRRKAACHGHRNAVGSSIIRAALDAAAGRCRPPCGACRRRTRAASRTTTFCRRRWRRRRVLSLRGTKGPSRTLGAKSVKFIEVGPQGADSYEVEYAERDRAMVDPARAGRQDRDGRREAGAAATTGRS